MKSTNAQQVYVWESWAVNIILIITYLYNYFFYIINYMKINLCLDILTEKIVLRLSILFRLYKKTIFVW